jgi:hypothetical protein
MESRNGNAHADAGPSDADPDAGSVDTDSDSGPLKSYADARPIHPNADAGPFEPDADTDSYTASLLCDIAAVRTSGIACDMYVPVSDDRSPQWQMSAIELPTRIGVIAL